MLKAILLSLAAILAIIPLIGYGALYFFQEKFLFVPSSLAKDFKFQFKATFKEIVGQTDQIHSLYFPAENPRGLFVYLHGNANNLSHWGEVAVRLSEHTRFSVMALDYPGYGKSIGSIRSEKQLHKIAQDFLNRAKEELGPEQKLVIYGRSIGTGLASKLAEVNRADGLILETPYESLKRIVKERAPFIPSFLLKYQLRSDIWLPLVKCPILILHGTNDQTIPLKHAEDLAPLNKNAELVIVPGGGHSDLPNYDLYWKSVTEFLNKI